MDWKAGDLALCVRGGKKTREGGIYTVVHIHQPGEKFAGMWNNYDYALLSFAEFGVNPDEGSGAYRFRKIHPHEPDAEDAATIYELVYAPSPQFTEIGVGSADSPRRVHVAPTSEAPAGGDREGLA